MSIERFGVVVKAEPMDIGHPEQNRGLDGRIVTIGHEPTEALERGLRLMSKPRQSLGDNRGELFLAKLKRSGNGLGCQLVFTVEFRRDASFERGKGAGTVRDDLDTGAVAAFIVASFEGAAATAKGSRDRELAGSVMSVLGVFLESLRAQPTATKAPAA